jgi:uncharacterized protein (DUF58 family)
MRFARVPRIVPTRRLAVLVAATAAVWLLSDSRIGLMIAVGTVVAIILAIVGDTLATPALRDIDVRRDGPQTIGLGEAAELTYEIRSRWPGRITGTLFDQMPAGVETDEDSSIRFTLEPRQATELRRGIRGVARGRRTFGRVVLRVNGPIGLIERTLSYFPDDSVLVTPSLAGVRRYRLLAVQRRLRDAGIRSVRLRGEGTSFASLRGYSIGDDPRHIDWKATAKRRTLITREYAVEQGQTVMILIDAGRMMTQLAGGIARFEHTLTAALTLADVAISGGDRVGLMLFDDEVRAFVPPARGRAALPPLRDALIPATARLVEPDYAAAFRTLGARHRKRSLLVIFSDVIDRRASAAIIAHTTRAASRHLPLVVALRNDELLAAALPGDDATPSRLYEAAAAEELVMARAEALRGMRQTGVDVLDISPRAMTSSVINRYLEIKARASL